MKPNNIRNTCLIFGLLISIFPYVNIKASNAEAAATIVTLGGGIFLGSIGFHWYSNHVYKEGKKRYRLLNHFKNNPDYKYAKLKEDATDQYYEQCCVSSESLENDFPTVWLEKDATSKKKFLGLMFLSKKMMRLSKKLKSVLPFLRNNKLFKKERKEYNKEYREQRYREDRLQIEREKLFERKNRN